MVLNRLKKIIGIYFIWAILTPVLTYATSLSQTVTLKEASECIQFYIKKSGFIKEINNPSRLNPIQPKSGSRKIVIITDAWNVNSPFVKDLEITQRQVNNGELYKEPNKNDEGQINGVVKTLALTTKALEQAGHQVEVIHPELFFSIAIPTYKAIRLAVITPSTYRKLENYIKNIGPDNIHIATEGPLGWAVRRIARTNGWNITTSYHTQFPEYLNKMFRIPVSIGYLVMRKFHSAASQTMITTETMKQLLSERDFSNMKIWGRGVDTNKFVRQNVKANLATRKGPLFDSLKEAFDRSRKISGSEKNELTEYNNFDEFINDIIESKIDFAIYVGRVSVEKSIEDFLEQKTNEIKNKTGKKTIKLIIGPGPNSPNVTADSYLTKLQNKYPETLFVGGKTGKDLIDHYSLGQVFVFPSRTDTFGNVIIEAMAMGMPVVAYDVAGPRDIIVNGVTGRLVGNKFELLNAIEDALNFDPEVVVKTAKEDFTPQKAITQFIENLVPAN